MSWQTLFSIMAASVGAVSGGWLCFGAAVISPARIAQAADDSWKANPDIRRMLVVQSGQYIAGGALLMVAFVLQLVAATASASTSDYMPSGFTGSTFIVLGSAPISALISYPIYRWRTAFLMART
jgi:hypothetical protein